MKISGICNAILWIILATFTQAAFAQYDNDERVLLTIDENEITVAEFMNVYQKNNVNNDMVDRKSIQEYLDLFINFKLKVREAKDLGMDTAKPFLKELSGYRDQLAEPYFVDEKVNEQLLKNACDRMQYDVRASHILVKLKPEAEPEDTLKAYNKAMEIRQRILNGEDFAKLAREVSDDPSAKDRPAEKNRPGRRGNHGDLGYFSVFDMIYPFENAAYNTPVGEITMPVRTDYGYHIIKVTDKQPALGRAQVAHIYKSFPNFATAEDSVRLENEMLKIYQELQSGAGWEETVRKYSDDKGTIERGGLLPWFGSNRMVPQFIQTVKTLQDSGDYSKPLLTVFGWHIIQLRDRETPGNYEEEKETLKRRLIKDSRAKKSRQAVIKRIRQEYGFEEFPGAREEIYSKLDSSFLNNNWNASVVEDPEKPLLIIGKQTYTKGDFARHLEKNQIRRGIKNPNVFFQEQYDQFAEKACIAYEDKHLEEKYPEFRMLMQEYKDGILLFNLTDEKVWSKAIKDTAGLKRFHEQNKKDYMWDKRVDATLYIVNPELDVDKVKEMVKNDADSGEILEKFNTGDQKHVFIESGKFARGDNALVDKISWGKGISKIYEVREYPSLKSRQGIQDEARVFVKIKEKIKPQPKTLDEARGLITSDYQNYLEAQWIKQLKNKYKVEVNEDVLLSIK